MKELIKAAIKKYVLESTDNWFPEINDHYYDEPIIKFASADDPLFVEYKTIIGKDHLTPGEAFEMAFGQDSYRGGTVISIVLPISEPIKKSNRSQQDYGSREWALLRSFGDEIFIKRFVHYVENFLSQQGHRTIGPYGAEWFKIQGSETGPISNWSERHIAYVTGLGTFSINDGFITEKGIAIRLISVVTELTLTPDSRVAKQHTENCLLCSKDLCGACIARCPVQAITKDGHDKIKCWQYVYGEESKKRGVAYGGFEKAGSGCGLCQTKVPCESENPMRFT